MAATRQKQRALADSMLLLLMESPKHILARPSEYSLFWLKLLCKQLVLLFKLTQPALLQREWRVPVEACSSKLLQELQWLMPKVSNRNAARRAYRSLDSFPNPIVGEYVQK